MPRQRKRLRSFYLKGILPLFLLGASSCQETSSQMEAHVQSSMRQRPVVTIVPIIDSTSHTYSWNLSDELTSQLHYRLSQKDRFYLTDFSQAHARIRNLNDSQNPFGPDFSWVKKAFHGDEFVAFLELVEHQEVLRKDSSKKTDPNQCSADFNMSMRIRVFDLRGKEVKVILQELVHSTHFIPRQYTQRNSPILSWKEEGFHTSALGLAHGGMIKEVASRLEDYIVIHTKS